MRALIQFCVLTLLFGSFADLRAADVPERLVADVTVEFTGASTLHDFSGEAPPMTVTVSRSAGESAWAAQVELPVAGIRTGNGWRDASMRKMFDAERYPVITARFDRIEPVRVRPGDGRGSLPFVLEIGRVAKPIRAAVGTWKEAADQVAFEASFDVSLAEFGLEAPSVMGLAQVDDTVRVRVHAVVRVPPR